MSQSSKPFGLTPAARVDMSRRRFLARLAALPTALGLAAFITATDDAEGKRRNEKRKKRGGKKRKGNGGGYSPDSEERKFLDLINDYRKRNGAGPLSLNDNLGAAADAHSRDMAKKDYFRHSNTKQLIERHGYNNWKTYGENIAAGQETAEQVFKAWQKSNPHDKNMRDKSFTDIGIGRAHAKRSKYGWYWTTIFGDR